MPLKLVSSVGTTEPPEMLIKVITGGVRKPTNAVPRLLAADRSSTSVSDDSCTLPRFSASSVKVTSKVPSASNPPTTALLARPICASSAGGATGVGEPGPPGLVVGSSPVGLPSISVVVLLASRTMTLVPWIVPCTVAELLNTAGAPAAFGSIFTVNSTEN